MRTLYLLFLLPLCVACYHGRASTTVPVPQVVLAPGAPGPDRISCDTPVVIKATKDGAGDAEERTWLNEHYPGHGLVSQALQRKGRRAFDILDFEVAERHVSVCFDITSSFGHL